MSGIRAIRAMVAVAAVGGSLLAAPRAEAGGNSFFIDATIQAPGGALVYAPSSFRWNEQFEVSFTHPTDSTSVTLMGLSQGTRKDLPSAQLHERVTTPNTGTAVVTLQMSGVRVSVVHEEGNANNSNGPEETVVLRFKSVTYTYQGYNAAGVALGPPSTITFTRGGWDPNGL